MNRTFDRTAPWHLVKADDGSQYLGYAAKPARANQPLPLDLYAIEQGSVGVTAICSAAPDGSILLPSGTRCHISMSGRMVVRSHDDTFRVENSTENIGVEERCSASPQIFIDVLDDDDGLDPDKGLEDLIEVRANMLGASACPL